MSYINEKLEYGVKNGYSVEAVKAWNSGFSAFTISKNSYKDLVNVCKALSREFSGTDVLFSSHLWKLANVLKKVYSCNKGVDYFDKAVVSYYPKGIDLSMNSKDDVHKFYKLISKLGTISHNLMSSRMREGNESYKYLDASVSELREAFLNISVVFESMC